MIPDTDALEKGPASRFAQPLIELRLAYQEDADQLFFSHFQVREEADFLQQVEGELMGLVDDQQKMHVSLLDLCQERLKGDQPGDLTLEQVTGSVLNVARYDIFQLPAAMLAGDAERLRKTMPGLEAEGEALPLLLWVVSEELRMLLRVQAQVESGRPFASAIREHRAWGREKLVERALARLSAATLAAALQRAAEIDRVIKGLRAANADSDAWLELTDLVLGIALAESR